MSRVAKAPVNIPADVDFKRNGQAVVIKGKKGEMSLDIHESVVLEQEGNVLKFSAVNESRQARALSATMRVLVNNMVIGVTQGFEKKLVLNGVGYRAKASGSTLNLSLGFSHPIDYELPKGVKVDTPTQTEVVISGADNTTLVGGSLGLWNDEDHSKV